MQETQHEFTFTEEQLDALAEKIVQKQWENITQEVGKGTLKFLLWLFGAAGAAAFTYFKVKT